MNIVHMFMNDVHENGKNFLLGPKILQIRWAKPAALAVFASDRLETPRGVAGRVCRQPGQVRKEAATTVRFRVARLLTQRLQRKRG